MIYWLRKYFTEPRAHFEAGYEVLFTAIFSIAPFIITYFVESTKHQDGSFIGLEGIVGRGQLYLLTYGVFGTIFWLAFMKGDKPRHGARALLGGVATFSILPVVGFLGVDPTFSTVLNQNIVRWSYWFYAFMLFINYLLLFYMNISPPQASEIFTREIGTMRNQYEESSRHG